MSDNNPYFLNNYTFRPYVFNNSSNNVFMPKNTVMPVRSQNYAIPPPPLMPRPNHNRQQNQIPDQEFVKQYERFIATTSTQNNKKPISITEARKNLQKLLIALEETKQKQAFLKENLKILDTEEWSKNHQEILNNKSLIEHQMAEINDIYLNMMCKALLKRTAKRMRLKRVKGERQMAKQELMKKRQEKTRSIDESLQKIVDDLTKVKKEEECKLQADAILKEVLRKKHDAKKYISKLDALLKLRKARLNTAKGRGVAVSESATFKFNDHIEKLSLLWTKKLATYEKEEIHLRNKIKTDTNTKENLNNTEKEVDNNLKAWQEYLFGDVDVMPQRNFGGDLKRFVEVRSDWDQYVSQDGTSLPVGWVLPE